ncbi:MAG: hypothetical protein JWO22_3231 [Frankiales bacterium]|nr:hypothetical protein [Frankiales bacterium]
MLAARRRPARRLLLPFGLAVALAGCGSTVQQSSTAQSLGGADGVSPSSAAGQVAGTSTGQLAGGGTGGQAVGGGGTGTSGTSSATSGTGGASRSGSGSVPSAGVPRGLKNVTSPISIGILDLGSPNGAASALGAGYSTTTSGADVTKALVRYYNKHGGIAGRAIKPVEYTIQVTSGNYQTEMQAACADFTQDHKVAATISVLANSYFSNYEACLSKAGVPDFAGPTGSADEHDLAAYPGFVSVSSPSTNRRFTEMINRFVASGYLTAKSKVGVIVEDCSYNTRAYDQTIAVVAKSHGISLMRRDISCINGFADAGSAISAFGSAVLPFRSAGVDRVMFVSNYEGVGLFAFENNASSQGYQPSYLLTSTSGGSALAGQFNDAQLHRMRGVGWSPVLDVAPRVQASPSTKRCRTILAGEGIRPQSKADDLIDIVCDQFFALEATLKATSGHSSRADLLSGLRSLGTSYVSAFTLGGATDYTTRRDGPREFAIWGYSTKCSCMDYLTPPS